MPTQEDIDKLCNERDSAAAANLKNQQGWDAEIQRRKDDAAKHEAAIAKIVQQHSAEQQSLKDQCAEAIQAAKSDAAAQLSAMAKQHAEEIAKLKASVLVPALKDLQARRQADLDAQHAAELAQLQG